MNGTNHKESKHSSSQAENSYGSQPRSDRNDQVIKDLRAQLEKERSEKRKLEKDLAVEVHKQQNDLNQMRDELDYWKNQVLFVLTSRVSI